MKNILANKFFTTALAISSLVFILVLLLSPKPSTSLTTPTPSTTSSLAGIVPLNLSKAKREAAMVYTASIEHKLPLVEEKFATSVGIITSIRIGRADYDPAEIVHLDINGLSYINKDELDEKENPNVTAFKESYLKAIELLEGQNIDPKKLIFVYGDKAYVQETATHWVDMLKLPHL